MTDKLSAKLTQIPTDADRHDHPEHQLVLGVSGASEFQLGSQGGKISPMTGCVVTSDLSHYFGGLGDNECMIIDIPLSLEPTTPDDAMARLLDKPRFFNIDADLQRVVQFARYELQQQPDNEMLKESFAYAVTSSLQRRLVAAQGKARMLNITHLDGFLASHLTEKITVEQLAAEVNCSPSHFHSLFKQQTGQTPHQYILAARLNQVHHLLAQGQLSLNDIAQQCGFSSQSALTTAVKNQLGITPGKLRKQLIVD